MWLHSSGKRGEKNEIWLVGGKVLTIEVENLSFGYQGQHHILQNISFSAAKGEVICLLGPNGTGKTTLLRCLLGINRLESGTILLGGRDATTMTHKEKFCYMAYVPQNTSVAFSYTATDVVFMGRNPHLDYFSKPSERDMEITLNAFDQLNIAHLAQRCFDELSSGERQMVLIARALAQQAKLLVMDEPTSALDYGNQVRILKMIQILARAGYTIIMSSHYPSHTFLVSDKVLLMRNGKLLDSGHPDQVVTAENLTQLYATEIRVARINISDAGDSQTKICIPLMDDNYFTEMNIWG
jgi:iron complex transport system ATP-binding protein